MIIVNEFDNSLTEQVVIDTRYTRCQPMDFYNYSFF